MFNVNSSSINPYFYSLPEGEELSQVLAAAEEALSTKLTSEQNDNLVDSAIRVRRKINDRELANFNRISIMQAEEVINEICAGREFNYLSYANVFLVAIMQEVQALNFEWTIPSGVAIYESCGKMGVTATNSKKELKDLTLNLYKVFRLFREYSQLLQGKTTIKKHNRVKILEMQNTFIDIISRYTFIQGLVEKSDSGQAKSHCRQLGIFLEVLYYYCHDEDFLLKYTKSLTEGLDLQTSVLLNPPTSLHLQLLEDSIKICSQPLDLLEEQIKEEYQKPVDEARKLIRQKSGNVIAGLEQLDSALENFITTLTAITGKKITRARESLDKSRNDHHIIKAKPYFDNLDSQNGSLLNIVKEVWPLAKEMRITWGELGTDDAQIQQDTYDACVRLENALKTHIPKIKKIDKKLLRKFNSLNLQNICIRDNFYLKINSLHLDNVRTPTLIAGEFAAFFYILKKHTSLATKFQNSLQNHELGNQACSAFTAIDLLFHQTAHFLSSQGESIDKALEMKIAKIFQQIGSLYAYSRKLNEGLNDPVLEQNMGDDNVYEKMTLLLTQLCQLLLPHLEQNADAFLKQSVTALNDYLDNYNGSLIFSRHLLCTLFGPLNDRNDISLIDLPMIKRHFALIDHFSNIGEISYGKLKRLTKQRLAKASQNSRPYLKLCYQHLILAAIELDF